MTFRDLIIVAKPGIIAGNLLVAVGGYLYASTTSGFDLIGFLALLAGTTLLIAGACVINNLLDKDIDAKMKRTSTRPSANGSVSVRFGVLYAALLLAIGSFVLLSLTNLLTFLVGAVGVLSYAFIYTYAKKRTHHASLIGTLPGATPPLAGYAAATGSLDAVGWLLFAVMVFWQMPHFYAIALFRRDEYAAAAVPVITVARTVGRSVVEIRVYALLFFVACCLLVFIRQPHEYVLGFGMAYLSAAWLRTIWSDTWHADSVRWARALFVFSLKTLTIFAVLLSLSPWLP